MKKRFLFYLLIGSLVLFNGCKKEHSFEGGAGPSEGTLQDDGTGDCLPKTVAGVYVVGTALVGSTNYIEVNVNVTTAGRYTIYTDTVNGISFKATGIFTATGANTVRLPGTGTPAAAGTHNFVVSYGSSGCSITVTTSSTLGAYTFDGAPGACSGANPSGSYVAGTALTSTNTVNININVTALGAYSINTSPANGMTFVASGVFTTLGPQAIVLTGTGTPATAASTDVPITAPGGSNCSFTIPVAPAAASAVFTVNCTTAVVNGTYVVGTALVSATNTITLPVTVTTIGAYTITATLNGMTFSASGTFTTATAQNVTLAGTGTPTTAGVNSVPVSGAGCNINVNVNPGAGGAAVFTTNCATATVNGTYTVGTALVSATNTISLPVTVTTAGTYTITATLNGMTFSASGTFPTATPQTVTLAGTGTPTTQGANSVPVTGGTGNCNVTVNVNPGAGGPATFTVDCSSAVLNGYLTKGVAIAPVNTIEVDVNVATPGTYTISTTPINGISYTATGSFAAAGTVTVTLTGTGTPTNSGTFTLNIPSGNPACGFDVVVDPNMGTWTFKVGTTTYSGTIYDASFDNTNPPASFFFVSGDDATGNLFDIALGDVNGTIVGGEIYKCAPPVTTNNIAGVYYDGVNGTTYAADPVDVSLATNTVTVTVTSHNTTTKTITGTFSGNAILNGGTTLAAITNGAFTVTYP